MNELVANDDVFPKNLYGKRITIKLRILNQSNGMHSYDLLLFRDFFLGVFCEYELDLSMCRCVMHKTFLKILLYRIYAPTGEDGVRGAKWARRKGYLKNICANCKVVRGLLS